MAASMGKRYQPDKSEGEKRASQESLKGYRPAQPPGTKPVASPQENTSNDEGEALTRASELIRRSPVFKALAKASRPVNPEPPSPLHLRSRKHRQHQQLLLTETPLAPRPKTIPFKPRKFPQQPVSRTPNPVSKPKNYPKVDIPPITPTSQKPQRFNPWQVKPNNLPDSATSLRQDLNLTNPTIRGDSPSISSSRSSQRRSSEQSPASKPIQPQPDLSNRRLPNNQLPLKDLARRKRNKRNKAATPKLASPPKNPTPRRPQKRPFGPLVYIIRLLILGIGIGTLAGTILSALNPTRQDSVKRQEQVKTQQEATPTPAISTLRLTQEIPTLKAQIESLAWQYPTLKPGVFIVNLDNGEYLDLDGGTMFASASTIKLPILVAFFQDVDAGKVRLDEMLTLKPEMIAEGSGDLQFKTAGTKFSALELATKMIVISDNTATNMLIERLGGMEVLNKRFANWGLTTTALRNRLPDVEGTNTTSPQELANLMSVVYRGNLVSSQSRDRLFNIMQRNEINNLLPQGLGVGANIAHKTGNIGSLLADAGLVDLPTGKRYAIAVMVKRPFNDASAQELIRQISKRTYDYFNSPSATPTTTPMLSKSPKTLPLSDRF